MQIFSETFESKFEDTTPLYFKTFSCVFQCTFPKNKNILLHNHSTIINIKKSTVI